MKKLFVMLLVGMMCLSAFTGCGSPNSQGSQGNQKSEEQQAMDEIRQHMVEEAAADGVDLESMIAQEMADYTSRSESRAQDREAKQASKDELDAYYNPLLQAEYDAVISSVTAEDTKAHGDRYNELIAERNAAGEASGVTWGGRSAYLPIDNSYLSKAMFLSAQAYNAYEEYHMYHTGSVSGSKDKMLLLYANTNEYGNWSELALIHEDFSACQMDLTSLLPPEAYAQINSVSDSFVELYAIENSDYHYFLFDITGPEAVLMERSTDYSDYEIYRQMVSARFPYEECMGETLELAPHWDDTLDELNQMIIQNSEFGAASDAYR